MSVTMPDLRVMLVDETSPTSVMVHVSRKDCSPRMPEYPVDKQLILASNPYCPTYEQQEVAFMKR